MQKDTEETVVVFRKWPENGHIDALFPEVPWDYAGNECTAYARVGEHSGASYYHVIQRTKPATPEEYADLKALLENVFGYNLRVLQKASYKHHEKRRATARKR